MAAVQPRPATVLGKRSRATGITESPSSPATRTTISATPLPKRVRRLKQGTSVPSTPAAPFVLFDDNQDEAENPFYTPGRPSQAGSPADVIRSSPGSVIRSGRKLAVLADLAGRMDNEPVPSKTVPVMVTGSTTENADDEVKSPTKQRVVRPARRLPASLDRASLKVDLGSISPVRLQGRISGRSPASAATTTVTTTIVPPQTPRHIRSGRVPATPRQRVLPPGKPMTPRSPATPGLLAVPMTPRTGSLQHPPIPVFRLARQLFTRSNATVDLVGRERERAEVEAFIRPRIDGRSSGCLYVSGPPGTGKTAFVTDVCTAVQKDKSVEHAVINCMGVTSGRDLAGRFFDALGIDESETATGRPMDVLKRRFHSRRRAHLIVLDEIDQLVSVDLDFMNTVFDWALEHSEKEAGGRKTATSNLVLVGIANALDFADRFLPRVRARSAQPTVISFSPYSAEQIAAIVTGKLRTLLPEGERDSGIVPFIQPTAISFMAKKVAAHTGDLRRAFDLARAAIDAVETDTRIRLGSTGSMPIGGLPSFASRTTSPLKPKRLADGPAGAPPTPVSAVPPTAGRTDGSDLTVTTAPKASISHLARITAAAFTHNGPVGRIRALNVQQKAVLCVLTAATDRLNRPAPGLAVIGEHDDPAEAGVDPEAAFHSLIGTPSRSARARSVFSARPGGSVPSTPTKTGGDAARPATVASLYGTYTAVCRLTSQLAPVTATEFGDVLTSLEAASLVAVGDGPVLGSNGPTTPSRRGRSGLSGFDGVGGSGWDEWKVVTLVADPKDVKSVCLAGPAASILERILLDGGASLSVSTTRH